MSRYVDVFVQTEATLEEFISELEQTTSLQFEKQQDGNEIWYDNEMEFVHITVGYNPMIIDKPYLFDDYDIMVGARARNVKLPDELVDHAMNVAREIFRRLKGLGKYPLALFEEVSAMIDRFDL